MIYYLVKNKIMGEYCCPKCGETPRETLYTYKKGNVYRVAKIDGHYFITTLNYEIDKRFKEIKEEDVYPKITNYRSSGSLEWASEKIWEEEHLCECGEKFIFENGSH